MIIFSKHVTCLLWAHIALNVITSEQNSGFCQCLIATIACCVNFSEGSIPDLTLGQVLAFCTGADVVPPLGFRVRPSIEFAHCPPIPGLKHFPTANTCGFVLNLPVVNTYETFVSVMTEGIVQSPGFGLH